MLNGHLDVVPSTPDDHWTHDPWGGEVEAGRMYGRGAADMKSGVTAMLFAVRGLREAGVELAGDVLAQLVIDEECTGNGTLACLASGAVGDACIIPEPYGLSMVAAQPGVLWARITVQGRAAHGHRIHEKVWFVREMRQLDETSVEAVLGRALSVNAGVEPATGIRVTEAAGTSQCQPGSRQVPRRD